MQRIAQKTATQTAIRSPLKVRMPPRPAVIPVRPKVPLRPLSYKEALARSLILYARADREFSLTLQQMVRKFAQFREGEFSEPPALERRVKLLLPADRESAIKRARWLSARIHEGDLYETLRAREVLSRWGKAKDRENPKAIVIGMILGVVPPIGAGHIKRKKKMSLIVSREAQKRGRLFAEGASRAMLGILARALDMAGGNSAKLEPEMGEWFYGDREIAFYEANEDALRDIKKELEQTGILHETTEEDGKIAMIAITPSADALYQELHWGLSPLSD